MRLNMETLAPSLWVDSNVVDCWGAILNYEEQFKAESLPWRHFFPTGCLVSFFTIQFFFLIITFFYVLIQTNAMVNDPRLDEAKQWEIFEKEILAQLKKDDATLSLVELVSIF